MNKKNIITCYICGQLVEQKCTPFKLLKPAYFFLLSFHFYMKNNLFIATWRFFLGPFFCFFYISRNKIPICCSCCKILSLTSIAVYSLIFAGIIACVL